MEQHAFHKDGKKKIRCTNCTRYICTSYIGQKYARNLRCKACKTISIVYPPEKGINGGVHVIYFGPKGGAYTADLTEAEIEDSI